eukprot:274195-Karenia_brevis.AAC.1
MIVKELEELGYLVSWRVLNSVLVGGVPQQRSRLYIVAIEETPGCPAAGGQGSSSPPASAEWPTTARMVWPSLCPYTSLFVILDTAWFDNGDPVFPSPWPYPIPCDMCPSKGKNLNRAIIL